MNPQMNLRNTGEEEETNEEESIEVASSEKVVLELNAPNSDK